MRIRRLAVLIPLAALLWASAPPGVVAGSASETARCIRDPSCHRTFAVAHRGEGFGSPANSRAAVAAAVARGVPIVEIDLRQSRDGDVFVIHDGKLDDTTDRSGRIERLSSAEVSRARLKNGETLPRVAEIYDITRGRAILSVDFKTDPKVIGEMAAWLSVHGSLDDVIFFVNTGEEMAEAARVKKRHPQMIVMVRLLDTRVTVESTRAVFGRLPEIFHTDLVGANEVARLHGLGVKVYVNALPLERRWPPFKSWSVTALLGTGVDFVLTGEPETLMRKLPGAPR